jgi:hypothetical protein
MADGPATLVDREVTDAMRAKVSQLPAIREGRSTGAPAELQKQPSGAGVQYRRLNERNPEWLGEYWRECRALYAGGPRLLKDEPLMRQLFPQHANEAPEVYKDRSSRAFYVTHAGEIIDHLLAGFAQDPIRLTSGVDEETTAEKELPTWWGDFATDISPPGGMKQPLGSFAVECLREMFVTQTAWVLIDLPRADPTAPPPESRLEEETRGLIDPYLCLMPTENVVDWQVDDETNELEWVVCYWRTRRRDGIAGSRKDITERWMFWTREGWTKYEHTFDPTHPPKGDDVIPIVDQGTHPFGKVPFVRITVPEGMYAMGKLHSLAREHFNKRCAVSWAEYKSLFAILYEFMATPEAGKFIPQGMGGDPKRATNQVRGQGYSQLRGEKDRAEFVGPDPAPFKAGRESCAEIMQEMHRVMFSMALSADMGTAALQRSGDSKAKDAKSIEVILVKVGEIIREGVDAVLDLVSSVRKEAEREVSTTGGEKFDADSVAAAIEEAVELLNGVPLRSPTFLQRYLFRLYKLALGPSATDEDLAAIRGELETVITAESLMMADAGPPGPLDRQGQKTDGGDAGDDEQDDEEPAEPTAKPKSRRLISSKTK